MLTSRDKKILKFMEDTNLGLTINQAAMMFFPKTAFGYDYSRTRLKTLREMGAIKYYKNSVTDEFIYYFEKKPTFHDNCIMNVYSNLVYLNAHILHFQKEPSFMGGLYRGDAIIAWQGENGAKIAIIEVDIGHPTSIKKYEDIYNTGELQEKYGDFPLLLILHSTSRTIDSPNFTVINFDLKCNIGFAEKVLTV